MIGVVVSMARQPECEIAPVTCAKSRAGTVQEHQSKELPISDAMSRQLAAFEARGQTGGLSGQPLFESASLKEFALSEVPTNQRP